MQRRPLPTDCRRRGCRDRKRALGLDEGTTETVDLWWYTHDGRNVAALLGAEPPASGFCEDRIAKGKPACRHCMVMQHQYLTEALFEHHRDREGPFGAGRRPASEAFYREAARAYHRCPARFPWHRARAMLRSPDPRVRELAAQVAGRISGFSASAKAATGWAKVRNRLLGPRISMAEVVKEAKRRAAHAKDAVVVARELGPRLPPNLLLALAAAPASALWLVAQGALPACPALEERVRDPEFQALVAEELALPPQLSVLDDAHRDELQLAYAAVLGKTDGVGPLLAARLEKGTGTFVLNRIRPPPRPPRVLLPPDPEAWILRPATADILGNDALLAVTVAALGPAGAHAWVLKELGGYYRALVAPYTADPAKLLRDNAAVWAANPSLQKVMAEHATALLAFPTPPPVDPTLPGAIAAAASCSPALGTAVCTHLCAHASLDIATAVAAALDIAPGCPILDQCLDFLLDAVDLPPDTPIPAVVARRLCAQF